MSQSPIWWRTLVLSTIVLLIAFAVGASGQGGKTGSTFATVDMQRISTEFKAKQAVEGDLKAMQDKYQARIDRRDRNMFLTEEEHKQIDELSEKATPTDADKKTVKDLMDKSQKFLDEYSTLTQNQNLDANGKKRLEDMTTLWNAARDRLNAMKDNLATEVRNYGTGKSEALMKEIRTTVAKVAKEKGVSIVFDGQVALYAGEDLTNATLSELNKGK